MAAFSVARGPVTRDARARRPSGSTPADPGGDVAPGAVEEDLTRWRSHADGGLRQKAGVSRRTSLQARRTRLALRPAVRLFAVGRLVRVDTWFGYW
jgi:hypothetical protein